MKKHPHGKRFDIDVKVAERDPFLAGSNVNLLMHVDEHDPISGIPWMSALPVAKAAAGR